MSHLFFREIKMQDNATVQPILSPTDFKKIFSRFKPLAEQKRIAEKIEKITNIIAKL